jgi:enoyl-CoA hydratase/carnithine racemase
MSNTLFQSDRIIVELLENDVAHVRLARPDKRNAVDNQMIDDLLEVGDLLAGQTSLRSVVLSGDGKSFCAGIDLSVLKGNTDAPETPIDARTHGNANKYQHLALQFRKLPVPVICAIHGVCFGAGLQIAAGADIRIASPDARLSIMELKWGIVADMAGHVLFQNVIREDIWRQLTFTAAEVNADDAQRFGLVTSIADTPLDEALSIANDIALKNPDAIRASKRLFATLQTGNEDDILLQEAIEQKNLLGSPNQMEAVMSQMEKRPPKYT